MIKEIKEFIKIQDDNLKFIHKAKDVADFNQVSLNAVYTSRRDEKKLDKLYVLNELPKKLDEIAKSNISISGEKEAVLSNLDSILIDDKQYKIYIKELRDE